MIFHGHFPADLSGFRETPPDANLKADYNGRFKLAGYNRIQQEQAIDWTFLSPSVFFGPGERTGNFRLGKDELLSDADGKSHISYEDYAIALLDEIEQPKHSRQRFTVGY